MMIDSIAEKRDFWLIYELCKGKTMNEHLFNVKGEFYKGERLYMVHHGQLYKAIRSNLSLLRDFLKRMCQALGLLARLGIVHADLKPDNIIIDFDEAKEVILSLKIIDLGSSFMLTPEGVTVDK